MRDLDNFIAEYEAALASQDWNKIAPLIHDDCVAVFSEGTHIGKLAIEIAFRKTFDLIKDEIYQISNLHWAVKAEQFSVMIYQFNWSGLIDGVQSSGSGRGSSTLIKTNDQWQIISEHLGPKPE